MSEPVPNDDEDDQERLELGRPRPEPRELMTAKQLVYAYAEARTDGDREYAAVEAESFLYSLGDEAATAVLVTMLQLPARQFTWPVVELVRELLAERAPAIVPTLLRVARQQ